MSKMLSGGGSKGGGHHRPYEGQQHADWRRERLRRAVIIAPTRGSNAAFRAIQGILAKVIIAPTRGSNRNARTACAAVPRSHHRPYEGQQRLGGESGAGSRPLSSSPLRGAATGRAGPGCGRGAAQSSSPLRGAATRQSARDA